MNFKAAVSEHLTKEHGEKRFVIVDKETNEVLDSNDGQGFTTENKAITQYSIKNGIPTRKEKEKLISKKLKAAEEFKNSL